MAGLRFDGTDDQIRFNTLAAALGNLPTGAYTVGVLVRRAAITDNWRSAMTMLATDTAKASVSVDPNNFLTVDYVGYPGVSNLLVDNTAETYLLLAGKEAGTATTQYSRYVRSTNTWTHNSTTSTSANQVATNVLQIGAWQTLDFWNGWIGLVFAWSGNMTNANRQLLSTNWRTSDFWTNPHGLPLTLIEGNRAATEWSDLTGNATNIAITGTTLDNSETFSSFNFNSTGLKRAADDFTGTDGTVLHTATSGRLPTGSYAGLSWTSKEGSVKITGNQAEGNDSGSANRTMMNDDLGTHNMEVEGDFTSTAASGAATFQGILARQPMVSGGIEFLYDHFLGKWTLEDGSVRVESAAEAWPGGTVKMKVRAYDGKIYGYANGVLKLSLDTTRGVGDNRAGILLGSFGGPLPKCDNFVAYGLPQAALPDADLATTGWTTTPLFSKVNDHNDTTLITATAA